MAGPRSLTATEGQSHWSELEQLALTFCPSIEALGKFTAVDAEAIPEVFRSLLAHDDHMTVALEAQHDSMVTVHMLAEKDSPGAYTRKSLLSRQSDGRAVQLGIMKIDLRGLPPRVSEEIRGRKAPLGRILIRNNLLREVELLALWRIEPGDELVERLGLTEGEVTYGRSARILVSGKPAVELLEIVLP